LQGTVWLEGIRKNAVWG